MEQQAIYTQVLILGIVGLIGVIAARTKVISPVVNDSLAGIIINITAPFLIISSLANLEFTNLIINNSILVFAFAYLAIFVLMILGYLSRKILNLNESIGKVHILHTTYGNIVFLGFPVINELFPGGEALLYAAIYQVASNSIMWTWAVYYLRKDKSQSFKSNFKKLANPNTIALLVGLAIMALQIKIPYVLEKSMSGLGNTTLYLAMLYIGALLTGINFSQTIRHLHVFVLSFNKLILGPFIVLIIIHTIVKLTGIEFSYIALATVVLEAAMPCMVIIIILVKKYGGDEKAAIENLFVTTVLCLFTLPLMNYLIWLVVNYNFGLG